MPEQQCEWDTMDTEGVQSPASKLARRTNTSSPGCSTGNTVDVPPTMQQSFFALSTLASRRSKNDIAAMSIPAIEVNLEQLEKVWTEIEQEWRNLRTHVPSETALERIGQEYARHADLYMELKTTLRTHSTVTQAIGWPTSAQANGSTAVAIGNNGQSIQIQLAEPITVPRFSGRDEDWARFRSVFLAEVHSNLRLNNSQKLRHLLNAIGGRARHILGNWTSDLGESYDLAWQSLCTTYDNEFNTIRAHLRKIDALRPIQRPTCDAIREVLDTVRGAQRQLQVLVNAENLSEHLLMHRIERLLDSETLSQWALRRVPSALPTLNQMYEFLELRASALLGLTELSGLQFHQRTRDTSVVSAIGRSDERRPDCNMCPGERHWPFKCIKFKKLSLSERWAHVNERRMCGNCFSLRHKANQCQDRKCPRCRTPHNSCLCPANTQISGKSTENPPTTTNHRAIEIPSTSSVSNASNRLP